MEVLLPDGTRIVALSSFERQPGRDEPEYGLYLDGTAEEGWSNDVVEWEDGGIPGDWRGAASLIEGAYERAKRGARVELGSRVGLGRTGTALACMATLTGLPPDDAILWVRRSYRAASVETSEQAAWVHWFSTFVAARPR